MLRRAGFDHVELMSFGHSQHTLMRGIDTAARRFESLYVEALKEP
jgi:hypothetical protein